MSQITKPVSASAGEYPAEELSWSVDGLKLCALAWGPANGRRVLALHGWLDNALSFAELARHMPDCRLVALDLTGHGLSDDRSPDATYQIWDDVPQILGVLDALGWQSCTVLAHSRGASIGAIVAAAAPERVERLIALDWFLPIPADEDNAVRQFRNFLADRARRMARPPRLFETVDDYVARRIQTGTEPAAARQLATRALVQRDGGFQLRGDARLFGASAVKLTRGQVDAFLSALTMPVLLFRFDTGHGKNQWIEELVARSSRLVPDFAVETIAGHHHCHMEESQAAAIARRIGVLIKTGAEINGV